MGYFGMGGRRSFQQITNSPTNYQPCEGLRSVGVLPVYLMYSTVGLSSTVGPGSSVGPSGSVGPSSSVGPGCVGLSSVGRSSVGLSSAGPQVVLWP